MMKGRAVLAALALAVATVAVLVAVPSAPVPSTPSMAPEFGPFLEPQPLLEDDRVEAPGDVQPSDPAPAPGPGASWTPAHTESFAVAVGDQMAEGLLGVPSGDPTTLLLIAHPWSVPAEKFRGHLQALADRGVLAAAMEFRGAHDAYKVQAGSADTVAAALELKALYPTVDRTLVYGHSMGGQVALLAAAAAPPGTFDYVFVGAGVTDLEALWHANVPIRPYVEQETGGMPADVPDAYAVRSPIDRVADLLEQGLERVFIVHGAGDAPVPVDHAERLYEAFAAAGLPVSYYVVTTDDDPLYCLPAGGVCPEGMPATHWAGRFDLMLPFIDHRIERMADPAEDALRGTYDGDSGRYEPSDVG